MKTEMRLGFGPLIASGFAGPIFSLAAAIGLYYQRGTEAVAVPESALLAVPGFLILSTIFGFMIALLPNLFGTMLMGYIGNHSYFSRTPAIWASVGAALPAVTAFIFWLIDPENINLAENGTYIMAFMVTGCVCALICRRHTRWVEYRTLATPERAKTIARTTMEDPRLLR
jgi:hypothetical protein